MSDATPASPPTPAPVRTLLDPLARAALVVAAAALVSLVAVQGWQVFARYVINDSPSWTEPLTLVLLSTAMSLAAAVGVHEQRHFRFNLLADAVGGGARRAMAALSETVVAAIGATVGWGAAVLWWDGLDVHMAGAPMPQSTPYLPLSIGGVLMTVFALQRLLHVLRAPANGEG